MLRTGGDAGKLGDRYEGIWTGDNLLDLIAGTALEILPEPFGEEAIGIEFWKTLSDGRVEYHSVRRVMRGASWENGNPDVLLLSSCRGSYAPAGRDPSVGFRVVVGSLSAR